MWDPKEQVSEDRKLVWGWDKGLRGLEEIIFHNTWRSNWKRTGSEYAEGLFDPGKTVSKCSPGPRYRGSFVAEMVFLLTYHI